MRPCKESDFKFMAEDKSKINWAKLVQEFGEYACVDKPESVKFKQDIENGNLIFSV